MTPATAPPAYDASTSLTFRLLVQETQRLARDPLLADRFRDGIDKGEGDIFRHFDLVRFADRVGLQPLERLVLASALVSATQRKELVHQAAAMIRLEFENAVLSLCQHNSFDQTDMTPNQVAKLMTNLLTDTSPDGPILDASQRQALIAAAQAKYGSDVVGPMLQRIFPNMRYVHVHRSCCTPFTRSMPSPRSLPAGTSLVQVLIQLGPEITSDADTDRALLARFGITETNPPRDAQVVEIVSHLSRLAAEGTTLCDVGSLVRALSKLVRPFASDESDI